LRDLTSLLRDIEEYLLRERSLWVQPPHIIALIEKGSHALEYRSKGLPPRFADIHTVDSAITEATAALEKFFPQLTVPSAKNLTRELKEILLGGCIKFFHDLSNPQKKYSDAELSSTQATSTPSTQAEHRSPEADSAAVKFLDTLTEELPQRPLFLQPSRSNPTIAAAERASEERREKTASLPKQTVNSQATSIFLKTVPDLVVAGLIGPEVIDYFLIKA
jgi:hypothetical protein